MPGSFCSNTKSVPLSAGDPTGSSQTPGIVLRTTASLTPPAPALLSKPFRPKPTAFIPKARWVEGSRRLPSTTTTVLPLRARIDDNKAAKLVLPSAVRGLVMSKTAPIGACQLPAKTPVRRMFAQISATSSAALPGICARFVLIPLWLERPPR